MLTSIQSTSNLLGRLFVFEGSDGVGKSTISENVAVRLKNMGFDVLSLNFPGKEPDSLGGLVYKIDHNSKEFGISRISAASMQTLHVAAHIDCIENRIIPAVLARKIILLDRYWWSTVAYGLASGISRNILDAMVNLEKTVWKAILPETVFLITRSEPFHAVLNKKIWSRMCSAYKTLYQMEKGNYPVSLIENAKSIEHIGGEVIRIITNKRLRENISNRCEQTTVKLRQPKASILTPRHHWIPTKVTEVFDTYWRFAAERQAVFFKRCKGDNAPWTDDHILRKYKFTNAYRASDRVSQYLIRHVIYEGDASPEEIFFRTILFKTFNKIETWKLLLESFGQITWHEFDFKAYNAVLTQAKSEKNGIYSGAYIMPSGTSTFGHRSKHSNHLSLVQTMMNDNLPSKVCDAKSMQEVFKMLRDYPMIGDFLAYQYATDINYSELTNFSEMSFVVPGPGAKDGLRKCCSDPGGLSDIDLIKLVADRQDDEFARLGLDFQDLWGRKLQLIDCQNLFCEVDKYARVAHPEIRGISGRNRIKRIFRATDKKMSLFYPPKWNINDKISQTIREGSQIH